MLNWEDLKAFLIKFFMLDFFYKNTVYHLSLKLPIFVGILQVLKFET